MAWVVIVIMNGKDTEKEKRISGQKSKIGLDTKAY
jgi:hypothetical protein